jgi:hypothetical protein
MSQQNEHLQTLTEIRSMMERSSKFLSLSGLSGIAAGIVALIGAAIAYLYFDMNFFQINAEYVRKGIENEVSYRTTYTKWGIKPIPFLLLDGFIVLTLAVSLGFYFSIRKAKKHSYKFWDNTAKRLLINLSIPLIAGGLFALILLFKYDLVELIPPVTLIFYGLALINGSKYTLDELRYLGIFEIVLGLLSAWFTSYALLFWAIGFGVLHIVYGALMYKKYDR